jgi:uncharacterized membrane protein
MIPRPEGHRRLERLLAVVLRYSTWFASAVIAFGVLEILADAGGGASGGTRAVTIGIAMLISIPVLRVIVMVIAFAVAREYLLVTVAAVVLSIIALGVLLGMRGPARTPPSHALPGPSASRAGTVLSLLA